MNVEDALPWIGGALVPLVLAWTWVLGLLTTMAALIALHHLLTVRGASVR